jgi:hypothetical protein
MTYTTAEAREQLLDAIAGAIERLSAALSALSEAYEQADERTGERLEEALFGPTQAAYGRAKRTHAGFAERHEVSARSFAEAPPAPPAHGVKGLISDALAAIADADRTLAALQDSMMPVEVGDAELRAGLEQVRSLIGPLNARATELVRTFGR